MPRKKKSATALFEVMSAGRTLEPVVKNRSFFHSPSLFAIFKSARSAAAREPVEAHHAAEDEAPPEPQYVEAEPEALEPRPPREPWLSKLPKIEFDVTNAIIGVSAVVIVVGLTMLIVSKVGGSKPPTLSVVSTSELQKQPANPAVLDLPRRQETKADERSGITAVADNTRPADPPAVAAVPGTRIINLNYLMIQSFEEEKMTREAADLLNKNGIECTVIQGLPRWSASSRWWCIVGTKGFSARSTNTPEFQSYLAKIHEVSGLFAGRTKWKQFDPQLYRWGADSEASAK